MASPGSTGLGHQPLASWRGCRLCTGSPWTEVTGRVAPSHRDRGSAAGSPHPGPILGVFTGKEQQNGSGQQQPLPLPQSREGFPGPGAWDPQHLRGPWHPGFSRLLRPRPESALPIAKNPDPEPPVSLSTRATFWGRGCHSRSGAGVGQPWPLNQASGTPTQGCSSVPAPAGGRAQCPFSQGGVHTPPEVSVAPGQPTAWPTGPPLSQPPGPAEPSRSWRQTGTPQRLPRGLSAGQVARACLWGEALLTWEQPPASRHLVLSLSQGYGGQVPAGMALSPGATFPKLCPISTPKHSPREHPTATSAGAPGVHTHSSLLLQRGTGQPRGGHSQGPGAERPRPLLDQRGSRRGGTRPRRLAPAGAQGGGT